MVPTEPSITTRVVSQFSLVNIWNRLGRVVVVGLGAVQMLGRIPKGVVEWSGFGLALAGAIWTSETKN